MQQEGTKYVVLAGHHDYCIVPNCAFRIHGSITLHDSAPKSEVFDEYVRSQKPQYNGNELYHNPKNLTRGDGSVWASLVEVVEVAYVRDWYAFVPADMLNNI